MPQTVVRVFQDSDGTVPLKGWLDDLEKRKPKAYRKCLLRIGWLSEVGNQARRPNINYLRDGIYELRASLNHINYRILYFFCGGNAVCLSHGIKKKRAVPDAEIELAVKRRMLVAQDLEKYTAGWPLEK